MNNKYLTPVLVVALIGAVGAASFFAGMKFDTFEKNMIVEAMGPKHFQHGMNKMMVDGHAAGEVTAIDGNTLTVKLPNGLTEKIIITSDTDITKTNQGTLNDLQIGDRVMVFGKEENEEFAAETLQINPLTRKWIFE